MGEYFRFPPESRRIDTEHLNGISVISRRSLARTAFSRAGGAMY
jgi:hypothetical protein